MFRKRNIPKSCGTNRKKPGNATARHQYYPEEVLIEKMQSGEYGWLDYVNHFSAEWQEEYARYCEERNLVIGNDSAAEFVRYKDEQLEAAMEEGNA